MLGDPDLAHPADRPRRGPARRWTPAPSAGSSVAMALTLVGLAAVGGAVAAGARGARAPRRAASAWSRTAWPASSCPTCCPPRSAATCCGWPACLADTGRRPRRSPRSCSSASPAGSCCRLISVIGLPREPAAPRPRPGHARWRSAWRSPRSWRSASSCTPSPTSASAGASRPRTAGAGSRQPSTSGSTGCGTSRPPRPTCCSSGFAYQLVLVLAAVAAAQALGVRPAGLTALLAFFPAVAIAQVLPIGISGPRRARGRLRAVPRPARRGGRRTPSPSASSSTSSTSASACSAPPPSRSAAASHNPEQPVACAQRAA